MYILAIDSATPVAGAALLEDQRLLAEELANVGLTHSETLMPMVDRILLSAGIEAAQLDAVAVTIGPGSFTGLRIGLAAAKGLSLATGKPLIGLSTLEVLAHNIEHSDLLVAALLDARKNEVYGACFDCCGAVPQRVGEESAFSPQDFCQHIETCMARSGKSGLLLVGDGFYAHRDCFEQHWRDKLTVPSDYKMLPRAAALGDLAYRRALEQQFSDSMTLRPVYLRLSEAQHKLGIGEL